ncbi:MAG: T9SS type A sorting domain-containing protein [Flavobacteriales bacterium]|nr:T9SS type A sorting domain-containing protein [Flavobacteriales bacterium]
MKFKVLFLLLPFIFILDCAFAGNEICDNGIDDDSDGLIDLNDKVDCGCSASSSEVLSVLPNSFFEDGACPDEYDLLSNLDRWRNQSIYGEMEARADYINTCDWLPSQISNTGLFPFPNDPNGNTSNGIVAAIWYENWREGFGVCLDNKLHEDEFYKFEFDIGCSTSNYDQNGLGNNCFGNFPDDFDPIDVTLYGNIQCNTLPLANYNNQCPTSAPYNWIELGTITYDPQTSWSRLSISFQSPADILSILVGAPCNLSGTNYFIANFDCQNYFVFDNFILNGDTSSFETTIQSTGNLCTSDLVLSGTPDTVSSNNSYQWYRNGIAILGENTTQLNVSANGLDSGTYALRFGFAGPINNCSELYVASYELNVALSSVNQNSSLDCDGQVNAQITNGVAPYDIIWSTGTTYSSLPEGVLTSEVDLCAGLYNATASDNNGCLDTDFINVGFNCTDSITGMVLGGNESINDATVYLYDANNTTPIASTTVDNGYFSFNNFCFGNYILKGVAEGSQANLYEETYYFKTLDFEDAFLINMLGTVFNLNVNLLPTVGLQERGSAGVLSVSPNPTTDKITIRSESPNFTFYKIEIFNKSGLRVLEKSTLNQETEINLSELNSGIYFVRITTNEKTINKKIVLLKK